MIAKPPTYRIKKGVGTAHYPSTPMRRPRDPFASGWGGHMHPQNPLHQFGAYPGQPAVGQAPPQSSPSPAATGSPAPPAPQPGPVRPPETPESVATRGGARETYGLDLADINRGLYDAAYNYGGAPRVGQGTYALNPATGMWEDTMGQRDVVSNPNSALAGIGRAFNTGTTGINEDLNNRNSYFSGAHLDQQQKLSDETGRQRTGALDTYNNAIADLMSRLAGSRSTRNTALSSADLADIASANANAPVAEEAPPGAAAVAASAAPPPRAPGPSKANMARISAGLARRRKMHGASLARI